MATTLMAEAGLAAGTEARLPTILAGSAQTQQLGKKVQESVLVGVPAAVVEVQAKVVAVFRLASAQVSLPRHHHRACQSIHSHID